MATPKEVADTLDVIVKQLGVAKAGFDTLATQLLAIESDIRTLSVATPAPTPTPVPDPTPTPVPTPDPVPTPTPSAGSNQPAGFKAILVDTLKDIPHWPAASSTGWVDDERNATSALSIVQDSAVPGTGKAVAGLFPGGMAGGGAPFYVYRPFSAAEQTKSLFISMYVKHDANFDNTNGNVGSKFMWPAGDQVGGTQTYLAHNSSTNRVSLTERCWPI